MSAYMLDDKNYEILLDIMRSLYNNPQTRHDFPSFPSCAFTQYDWDVPAIMVGLMARLNHDSVNHRYRFSEATAHEDEQLQALLDKLIAQNKRPTNCRFQTYAKLADWFDVYGALKCWQYQSCELDNMDASQTQIMEWAGKFATAILEYGVRHSVGRQYQWGALEHTEVMKQSAGEPPVIDLMDLMR